MSSVLGVAALLCVHFDRAPLIGSLTVADQLIWLVIGGIVLSVSLLVWAIKTLYLVGREHRWSWKVTAVPAVVLVGLVAGLVCRPASFDSERAEGEEVAVETLRTDGQNARRDPILSGLGPATVRGAGS